MTPLPVMQLPTESLILYSHAIRHPDALCHPEFSSGSVRGEWLVKARGEVLAVARGEMLKQVQHDNKVTDTRYTSS